MRQPASPVALVTLVALLAAAPRVAVAQTQTQERLPLSEILPQLLGNTIVLQSTNLPDQPNHQAHFKPGPDQLEVPGQFNRALLTLLSTSPIGSPSGGFTYTFDPALGTFRRTSESFGPSFSERALTIGRDRVSVGFGYQRSTYDTFEGLNLRQRGVTFYVPHIDCCSRGSGQDPESDGSRLTPAFEGDLVEARLALDLRTDASVIAVNFGVTDRMDIGVVIPFLTVSMDASVLARIERLSTEDTPHIHTFEGEDPDTHTFRASGTASGLGDLVARTKYILKRTTGGGLAAGLDLRLPTGDETNLLGTGGVQARLYGIWSDTYGRVSPHANAGYTFSSHGALPGTELRDEVNVAAGIDIVLRPRATLVVDFIGRTLVGAGRMREADKTFTFTQTGGGTGSGSGSGTGGGSGSGNRPDETLSVTRRELQLQSGDLHLSFGSASIRFSPWRSVLVTAGVLFPMSQAGLRDRVTPVLGIDYAF
jgi:hypothetical protein